MRINKHDTNGTKPLLSKGELGYDDYTAGGDTGRVYVGTGSENIALAERLESNMMTKAQFNASAEERKANRAGSGFDEWGKHYPITSTNPNVNEGIWTVPSTSNTFCIGRDIDSIGTSKTRYPMGIVNGTVLKIEKVNVTNAAQNNILLPTAPNIYPHDATLTAEQIASGVIKHADASNSGLIVNGKFDTDTSGWTQARFTPTWQVDGSVYLDATEYTAGLFSQSIALITGKQYIVEVNVVSRNTTYTQSIVNCSTYDATTSVYGSSSNLVVGRNVFTFTADGTKPYIAIKSGSHPADYITIDNIAVYPADAISRSDLVFLESFHEDISEKSFVYPLGNVQYLGGNTDGLTGIANGNFTGFETYSLFGNFQASSALIGKGYVWSSLTEAQKKAFIANPENNCYLDGDKTIQVRYRVRVLIGEDTNSMAKATVQGKAVIPSTVLFTVPVTTVDAGLYSNTSATYTYTGTSTNAISIANVSRRNQGMYHPVYNANGTKKASDSSFWYNTAVSFTSISDCFDPAKLLTASGYIGSVSGRPDGLFYDQVHESDILDLKNSSKKPEDYNRLISREFNKLVAGTYRGKEGEWQLSVKTQSQLGGYVGSITIVNGTTRVYRSSLTAFGLSSAEVDALLNSGRASIIIGNSIYKLTYNNSTECTASSIIDTALLTSAGISSGWTTYNGFIYLSGGNYQTTRTKSNTLLHCDIIGNPTNYPTAWKQSGVFGTPLIVAEDGTSLLPNGTLDTFKLSRPVKTGTSILLALRSTDSGATWTSFTPTFSAIANAITLADEPAADLVMVYYQTKTSMAVPVANSEVLEIGDVLAIGHYDTFAGNYLLYSLLNKVSNSTTPFVIFGNKIYNFRINATGFKFQTSSGYEPQHTSINTLGSTSLSPAVKVFPYLTRNNGKAYLNLVFKEMKYNGTSWGDDSKFNIVDNVSTTTDNNAQTVLIGQKTVELPYFIGADE